MNGRTEMTQLTPASNALLDRYDAVRGELMGAELPWLAKLREDAAAQFRGVGLPTPRVEAWKYTNLNRLDSLNFVAAPDSVRAVSREDLPAVISEGARMVFVDGRFQPALSQLTGGGGVRVLSLAQALHEDAEFLASRLGDNGDGSPLLSLNGAFLEDGFVVLAEGKVEAPVEILHWDTGGDAVSVRQPRNIIAASNDAKVTVIESHAGAGPSNQFFNGVTMITVDGGATVRHIRLQNQGAGSVHVNTVRVRIGADAKYRSFVLATGAEMARDEVQVAMMASGADVRLDGIYLAAGKQHIDNTTVIRHARPNTTSRETYKGALDGQARAVFQGNIRVEVGADGSDGRLLNKTLLLSDEAEIDSKPQLEIYADEVQCAHGATAGELDETALFYLRSRGIGLAEARRILVEAFLTQVVEDAEVGEIGDMLLVGIRSWLAEMDPAIKGGTT